MKQGLTRPGSDYFLQDQSQLYVRITVGIECRSVGFSRDFKSYNLDDVSKRRGGPLYGAAYRPRVTRNIFQ